ncbi:PTS sugar transporter subunit IIA [Paratissierella segnis]|jgi:PTS system galactitol-specific IIA component|uniref:PTS sugar transporter subunit IIA n=1 Tax=Paratissierella segnis TaxID=2763679 RepID=A0A926ESC7_9FIRM|nr:PTS sugar transporter subunit IIA [Paratissierella segnis]MBC8587981.1 PTS sugar transporter subunit IIA [Paratissierella segnis]
MQNEGTKILDNLFFDKSLIIKGINPTTDEEALHIISKRLFDKKIVKESYTDSIIKREREFPTALELADINIAIPHTTPDHVYTPAIAIGFLENPVSFAVMGEPDRRIPVEMIFMLSITQPKVHLSVLKKLVEIFQEEGKVKKLRDTEDVTDVYNLFIDYMKD